MLNQRATELFEKMETHYGSHTAAAKALKLSRRAYLYWREGNFSSEDKLNRAILLMESTLARDILEIAS